MNQKKLRDLIEKLTGKPIRISPEDPILNKLLDRFVTRKDLKLNWNEFNEILLLCNKDRTSEGFFNFFFINADKKNVKLSIKEIEDGVERFRKYAMLVLGNFIYAYRRWSKYKYEDIKRELNDYLEDPGEIKRGFLNRPRELEKIFPIKKSNTHFVGYLSGKLIGIEWNAAAILEKFFKNWNGKHQDLRKNLLEYIKINGISRISEDSIFQIISKFEKYQSKDVNKFKKFIHKSLINLEKIKLQYEKTRETGELNTEIYLTWDYVDVYLATSMREKYDYEAFYDFTRKLFKDASLKKLKLRYFDPTQSFEKNRIDKGLIEGLMLKRANCTIYSIQESDTLGKDSELASTLAQGKPVIAYVPKISIPEHARFIKKQSFSFISNKIDLLWSDFRKYETLGELRKWLERSNFKSNNISIDDPSSYNKFIFRVYNEILEISSSMIWESIDYPSSEIKKKFGVDFEIICNFIAIADKSFYDRRAYTIQHAHPLGVQINLDNGVANGVLLVRTVEDCAKLLYNILLNRLEFVSECNSDFGYDCLQEKISKSIYRVVTKDPRLTNSFWNFYLNEED